RYDLKTVECICDQALPFLAGNVFVGEWKVDVLLHRKVVKQVIALKDHADLTLREFRALFTLHRVNRLVAEPEFPFPAVIEQSQDVQQGGLARTRRPHNRDEFALADFKINAAKYPGLTCREFVTAFQVFQLNHCYLQSKRSTRSVRRPWDRPWLRGAQVCR